MPSKLLGTDCLMASSHSSAMAALGSKPLLFARSAGLLGAGGGGFHMEARESGIIGPERTIRAV